MPRARDADRSRRAAPQEHDPPRADAVQERTRPDLRQRRIREDPRPGPRARRLERLRRAPRRFRQARQAARPRHRLVPRVDRWQCVRRGGEHRRHRRRHCRDLLGDAGDGPGHRHQLCPARGRRFRRADREDPHRPGRHRSRQRLRQRRLALALHRRLGGAGRFRADHRARANARRRGARGLGGGHRIPRRLGSRSSAPIW